MDLYSACRTPRPRLNSLGRPYHLASRRKGLLTLTATATTEAAGRGASAMIRCSSPSL